MRPLNTRPGRLAALVAGTAAAAALVLGSLVAAPAASSATLVTMGGVQPTGLTGVPQALQVTAALDPGTACGSILAPVATVYGTANGTTVQLGTATFANCLGSSTFQYTYQWVPSAATVWYIYATVSGTSSDAVRSAISPVPTTTVISAPATVKLGQAVNLTATVTAGAGAVFSPQGTVQFSVVGGSNIGSPVALNTATPSVAQIQWVPPTLGATSLIATYTPANAGTAGQNTTCGTSCTSAPDNVEVTSSGVNLYLSNPPGFSAGASSTLTAVVSVVPPSGTVNFTVNGAVLASNVPVQSNGQAQTRWTPPSPGQFVIAASWAGNGGLTGTAQETVSVGTAPAQADQIIITTSAGTTLTSGATYTVANATVITFTAQTASGSPVTFTGSGPCTITPTTFTATTGTGQCRLTASSPGGNGYGPATGTVTVNLVPGTQTAKLAAPQSGKVNVGKTITLEKASQGKTNAGQPITWSITKGKNSVCKLIFSDNGAVKLKMLKKGYCDVKAKAPAVSNQWSKFVLARTYQGV